MRLDFVDVSYRQYGQVYQNDEIKITIDLSPSDR